MFKGGSDRHWEKYGKIDPYFAVLTNDKFREPNLTDQNKEEFFNSGSKYIDDVLSKIKRYLDQDFHPKRAIDFGCGVGRLVIPLAKVAEETTGVDVSDSMLQEARKNCDAREIKNVTLVKSDDNLSLLTGQYDFIHSFIVFQHISVARGERIFEYLLERLEKGGVCVAHFTYAKSDKNRKLVEFTKKYIPLSGNFYNLVKGRRFFYPRMQMNSYNLNHLFLNMQNVGIRNLYSEFTNHGGELGVIVYFKK